MDPPRFVMPVDRTEVTLEPPQAGCRPVPEHQDQDWIGWENQGGGHVPEDFEWKGSPKEDQERVCAG